MRLVIEILVDNGDGRSDTHDVPIIYESADTLIKDIAEIVTRRTAQLVSLREAATKASQEMMRLYLEDKDTQEALEAQQNALRCNRAVMDAKSFTIGGRMFLIENFDVGHITVYTLDEWYADVEK
jgi:hypothetical protein